MKSRTIIMVLFPPPPKKKKMVGLGGQDRCTNHAHTACQLYWGCCTSCFSVLGQCRKGLALRPCSLGVYPTGTPTLSTLTAHHHLSPFSFSNYWKTEKWKNENEKTKKKLMEIIFGVPTLWKACSTFTVNNTIHPQNKAGWNIKLPSVYRWAL